MFHLTPNQHFGGSQSNAVIADCPPSPQTALPDAVSLSVCLSVCCHRFLPAPAGAGECSLTTAGTSAATGARAAGGNRESSAPFPASASCGAPGLGWLLSTSTPTLHKDRQHRAPLNSQTASVWLWRGVFSQYRAQLPFKSCMCLVSQPQHPHGSRSG